MKRFVWLIMIGMWRIVPQAMAQITTNPPAGDNGQTIQVPDPLGGAGFQDVVAKVVNFLSIIAIPLVAGMVIFGGIQLITSAGNENTIKAGKKTITYAVIGLIVVLSANAVVIIIQQLFGK